MKPCRRTVLLAVTMLVMAGGMLLLPAVHWRLLGWWRGEAFFRGRPTSYWSSQMRGYYYLRAPSPWDRLRVALGSTPGQTPRPAVLGPGHDTFSSTWVSLEKTFDEQAIPVLIELFRDENEWVRVEAVQAFILNKTADRRAVPALIDLWHREESLEVRSNVPGALRRLDPQSPALPEMERSVGEDSCRPWPRPRR